ncbi:MAG: CBS domain-containing protein [Gammaproteobacteria bacterium]|nr:CBS domain-containing protein [Gammaproteobacteria bacterium]MDH3468509.1 CBS domain-containing protein [Gammaproteobacteria bacterium]
MTTLRQLLKVKGHEIWSVTPDTSVFDTLVLMADKDVGALLVLDNGQAVGIISERDYARNIILKGRASKDTQVREVMTVDVVSAHPDQSVEECMTLMTDRRIRHLPVLEDGGLLGVISIGDLVKSIIAEQKSLIDQLEHYISG